MKKKIKTISVKYTKVDCPSEKIDKAFDILFEETIKQNNLNYGKHNNE